MIEELVAEIGQKLIENRAERDQLIKELSTLTADYLINPIGAKGLLGVVGDEATEEPEGK